MESNQCCKHSGLADEMMRFWRALFAFLACPGMVALAVPVIWLMKCDAELHHPAALVLLVLGITGLLACVRDFYVIGKGTLAPWAPPRHLVVTGLYRCSRNPMYVAVIFMLAGWSVAFDLDGLYIYTGMVMLAFHLRVVFGEEPQLKRNFGTEWDSYAAQVLRWFWWRGVDACRKE